MTVGVNADGHREILSLDVATAEDGAGWLTFLRSLVARGLTSVQLVISDAHTGLVASIGAVLPGASWRRCRTQNVRNLLSQAPKSAQPWVATLPRTVFEQPGADAVRTQLAQVLDALEAKLPRWPPTWTRPSTTCWPSPPTRGRPGGRRPQERRKKGDPPPHRRFGIFPDRTAVIRLVSAVLAEQRDEWTEARRHMSCDLIAKARLHPIDGEEAELTHRTHRTTSPTDLQVALVTPLQRP